MSYLYIYVIYDMYTYISDAYYKYIYIYNYVYFNTMYIVNQRKFSQKTSELRTLVMVSIQTYTIVSTTSSCQPPIIK